MTRTSVEPIRVILALSNSYTDMKNGPGFMAFVEGRGAATYALFKSTTFKLNIEKRKEPWLELPELKENPGASP
jgi:hypothetical protein